MNNTEYFEIAGESLALRPDRLVWWEARATLLAADTHLGKEATFRRRGVPLPGGGLEESLNRLSLAIRQTGARRLVVLGDFIHAPVGLTEKVVDTVAAWRDSLDLDLVVTPGNHDRRLGRFPTDWRVDAGATTLREGPFVLTHEPPDDDEPQRDGYVLSGHLHPTAQLKGRADSIRLACFRFDERVGVLPAFTEFSNGLIQERQPGRRLFVVADDAVVPV